MQIRIQNSVAKKLLETNIDWGKEKTIEKGDIQMTQAVYRRVPKKLQYKSKKLIKKPKANIQLLINVN